MKRSLFAASMLALALGGCGQSGGGTDGNAAMNDAATIETTGSPATIGAYGPGAVSTQTFVEQAAISDMYEIAAAKIALARSQSAEIKGFAQEMITAHTATSAKLKEVLPTSGANVTPPAALDDRRTSLIDALKKAAPDTFDELYLDQQTTAHREALGLMDSYATNGDNAALKALAAETKPKIQSHLEMVSKLDHSGADEGADAPPANSAG